MVEPGKPLKGGEEEQLSKIFLRGLASKTNTLTLRRYFAHWKPREVRFWKHPITKRCNGLAFVTFDKPGQVDEIIARRPHEIDGKFVEVRRPLPSRDVGRIDAIVPTKSLFVGKISRETSERDLVKHFSKYGKVSSVLLATNKATATKRGFGLVRFEDSDSVEKILLCSNEHVVRKRLLEVRRLFEGEDIAKVQKLTEISEARKAAPGVSQKVKQELISLARKAAEASKKKELEVSMARKAAEASQKKELEISTARKAAEASQKKELEISTARKAAEALQNNKRNRRAMEESSSEEDTPVFKPKKAITVPSLLNAGKGLSIVGERGSPSSGTEAKRSSQPAPFWSPGALGQVRQDGKANGNHEDSDSSVVEISDSSDSPDSPPGKVGSVVNKTRSNKTLTNKESGKMFPKRANKPAESFQIGRTNFSGSTGSPKAPLEPSSETGMPVQSQPTPGGPGSRKITYLDPHGGFWAPFSPAGASNHGEETGSPGSSEGNVTGQPDILALPSTAPWREQPNGPRVSSRPPLKISLAPTMEQTPRVAGVHANRMQRGKNMLPANITSKSLQRVLAPQAAEEGAKISESGSPSPQQLIPAKQPVQPVHGGHVSKEVVIAQSYLGARPASSGTPYASHMASPHPYRPGLRPSGIGINTSHSQHHVHPNIGASGAQSRTLGCETPRNALMARMSRPPPALLGVASVSATNTNLTLGQQASSQHLRGLLPIPANVPTKTNYDQGITHLTPPMPVTSYRSTTNPRPIQPPRQPDPPGVASDLDYADVTSQAAANHLVPPRMPAPGYPLMPDYHRPRGLHPRPSIRHDSAAMMYDNYDHPGGNPDFPIDVRTFVRDRSVRGFGRPRGMSIQNRGGPY